VKKSQRKLIVFTCLLSVLCLTSAALLALAPAPLTTDTTASLFAIDEPKNLDAIFETKSPVMPNRWHYIYIHHSQTSAGDAISLGQHTHGFADHFLVGNGDGAIDGEIQIGQRWSLQQFPTPPAGTTLTDPACISICIVGDFDRAVPTPAQMRHLTQLVSTLQGQLHISRENVLLINHANSPGAAGRYFPATAFKNQLLP